MLSMLTFCRTVLEILALVCYMISYDIESLSLTEKVNSNFTIFISIPLTLFAAYSTNGTSWKHAKFIIRYYRQWWAF